MKFDAAYSHHNGVEVWKSRDLYEWITDIFAAPRVKIQPRATRTIRAHVMRELEPTVGRLACQWMRKSS